MLLFCLETQAQLSPSFTVIPLGVKGGGDESNLSSYLICAGSTGNFVSLDAGTIRYGIVKAIQHKSLVGDPDKILKSQIKGYLISHAHLDHVAGLILNAPNDSNKFIYATPNVIGILKDKYFNWSAWANFSNEGEKPTLNKYHYEYLTENKEDSIYNTNLHVTPFLLSHSTPYLSTAFLIRNQKKYLLYFGDTGADSIERSNKIDHIWQMIAPIIKRDQLKAIFIEVSYPDLPGPTKLYGHLTPFLLFHELNKLANYTSLNKLKNISFVITHRKPAGNNELIIRKQLQLLNKNKFKLEYPVQGQLILF